MANKNNCIQSGQDSQKPGYLFVIPWGVDGVGGVNEVVLNLYDTIEKNGRYRPIILVNTWESVTPEKCIINGREIVNLRLRSPYSSKRTLLRLLLFFAYFPHNAYILSRLIRKEDIRVVNPHYPELPLYIFYLLAKIKIFNGMFILSIHGTDIRSLAGVMGLRKYLWGALVHGCNKIVACSHSLKNEAESILKLHEDRFCVIHNGISDSFGDLKKVDEEYNFQDQLKNIKYILNIGTFDSNKGQNILIKAFSLIVAQHNHYNLVLVGRKSPFLKVLKREVVKLGVQEKVLFFLDIPHDYMWQFYQFADFFVLPSFKESFPMVLLEAGAFRLPVIATNVGGVAEIILDGVNGRLVQSKSVEGLRCEMEKFCCNRSRINFFGQNLHKQVVNNFTWERAWQKYKELCDGEMQA